MASLKKFNGNTWVDSKLHKLDTATDIITTLPVNIYADGTAATIGLKGNTVQNGTPTPDNLIQPQGCGELETTGAKAGQYKIPISSAGQTTPVYLGEVETTRMVKKLVLDGTENWSVGSEYLYKFIDTFGVGIPHSSVICTHAQHSKINNTGKALFMKISDFSPISSAGDFKSYLAAQYAAGTPVTVWYILTEPQTGIVNEPLMKIGDYADSISGITIPTITGKDTVDVDTTLKPSEVSIGYTGWHDVSVKEWDSSEWI